MMKREQIKQLKAELQECVLWRMAYQKRAERRNPEFSSVRHARTLVRRHEAKTRKIRVRLEKQHGKLFARVQHLLYFGTEKECHAALQKLRRFKLENS